MTPVYHQLSLFPVSLLADEKQCAHCREMKPLDGFCKRATSKDGRHYTCRVCDNAAHALYYQRHREEVKQKVAAYARANAEKVRVANATRYQRHREARLAAGRRYVQERSAETKAYKAAYYLDHRDAIREKNSRYGHAHRAATTERVRQWRRANPDRDRAIWTQRRARDRGAAGTCSSAQFAARCAVYGWRCAYCARPLTPRTVTVDHRIPLSRGGSNWPANLAPACHRCNTSKHRMTETEYRARLRRRLT